MKCKNPIAGAVPCGQCLHCRINRQREWSYRILLEQRCFKYSSFVSLTYKDNPVSLQPSHLQKFMKDLRYDLGDHRIRFFAVGEYGEENQRPHYHLALFNYPSCSNFRTWHSGPCCWSCDLLRSNWRHGSIDQGELNAKSAQYLCGYVTKKLTNINHKETRDWLNGRHPEFMRSSQGIGRSAAEKIANNLISVEDLEADQLMPSSLVESGRSMYLGRYMKSKIESFTVKKDVANEVRLQKQEAKLEKEIQEYNASIQEGLSPFEAIERKKKIQEQILLNQSKKLEMRQKKARKL